MEYGLWTPNEAFFLLKSRTFGLGLIQGHLGYLWLHYQPPFWNSEWFSQETINIPKVYLKLGFEFWTQRIMNLAYCVSIFHDLGYLQSNYQPPFWYVSPLSMYINFQPLFLQKTNIYLGLGFEFEFGTQIIKNLEYCVSVVREMDLGLTLGHTFCKNFFLL